MKKYDGFAKLVIMDEAKRKELEGLTPAARKTLEDVFGENMARTETRLIVEMLMKAVIEIQLRLDALESDRKEH